jgi:hypothetical protein
MNDNNIKAGGDINAGDGGYNLSTQERYEEFAKQRNKVMNERDIDELIELIVKECVKEMAIQMAKFGDDQSNNPAWYKSTDAVMKHFGVE